jgi:hypothetical protein
LSDEIRRLLDGKLSPHVRSVLEVARTDGPTAAHLRRAAQALGLSATTAGLAHSAGQAGGGTAGKSGVAWSMLKWMGTASLFGGALVGAFVVWPSRAGTGASALVPATRGDVSRVAAAGLRPPEPPTIDPKPMLGPAPGPAAPAKAPVAAEATSAAVPGEAATPVATAADREAPHASPAPRPSRRDSEASDHPSSSVNLAEGSLSGDAPAARAEATSDTLREETTLLDAARRALQAGNASGAIALLDRYVASPSLRTLASEAQLLRARALAKAGRRVEACATSRHYVERQGTDGYAGELERFCAEPARSRR